MKSMALVGNTAKLGFETNFMANGFFAYGYAEALDAKGRLLGLSPLCKRWCLTLLKRRHRITRWEQTLRLLFGGDGYFEFRNI